MTEFFDQLYKMNGHHGYYYYKTLMRKMQF